MTLPHEPPLNPPDEPECPMCGDQCPWFAGEGDVCFSEDRGWDETRPNMTTSSKEGSGD